MIIIFIINNFNRCHIPIVACKHWDEILASHKEVAEIFVKGLQAVRRICCQLPEVKT